MINVSTTGIIADTNNGICYGLASSVEHSPFDTDMCLQT